MNTGKGPDWSTGPRLYSRTRWGFFAPRAAARSRRRTGCSGSPRSMSSASARRTWPTNRRRSSGSRSALLRKFVNDRYRTRRAPRHMWFGVSVEDSHGAARIAHLRSANASIRFLSVEPLIGPVGKLDLAGISWVIVGGESGPRARPMDPRWAVDVRDQCLRAKVAFFFKQWGGRTPKAGGRLLEGREWNQFPQRAVHALRRELRVLA